jgi:hypothetical protein
MTQIIDLLRPAVFVAGQTITAPRALQYTELLSDEDFSLN